jgi:branched-chain amino acid aminotransferase
MQTYYVDGKFLPADQAAIPVDDLAILRGIGVFDLMRTYNGRILFLKEHVDRLFDSARRIGLGLPWSAAEVHRVVVDTLSRNHLEEANVRIVVTGGSSPDFMTPAGKPRLIVIVSPLPKLPEWWYTQGVKVIGWQGERPMPGAKSIDYVAASMAMRKAKEQEAVEVIYVDREGNALEGSTSNLFAFIGDSLVTPERGILSGITRQAVLVLAAKYHAVQLCDIPFAELLQAPEVFITGTNKGVVPVVQIDDTVIGDGAPGERTLKLMKALQALTEEALS